MLKRTVMKSAIGAAVGTGAIALVAFGAHTPVALSDYTTAVATSMSTTESSPSVVMAGSAPQVLVTVSTTNSGAPTGTMLFTITTGPSLTTAHATYGPVDMVSSGANSSQATYTFPADTAGDKTYKVVAEFTGSNSYANNSITSYVTLNRYESTTTVTSTSTTYTAQVTKSLASAPGSPTGTVRFVYKNNGGTNITVDRTLSAGAATYTVPGNGTHQSTTYLGDNIFRSSTGNVP